MVKSINSIESTDVREATRERVAAIYNELEGIKKYLACYEPNGTLCFYISTFISIYCKIIPGNNDTYSIILSHKHNRSQKTILAEVNDVKVKDIETIISNTIDCLQNDWGKWNKNDGSWWNNYKTIGGSL